MTKHDEPKRCSICGRTYTGYGHNAQPVNDGYCCDDCLMTIVLPRRVRDLQGREQPK
jgi:hypothetical protein